MNWGNPGCDKAASTTKMNIPNILTLMRIVLIPVLVATAFLPFEWRYKACAIVFALAAATDWFDGYLARKLNQNTPFGAFLDPVADKLMVATALTLLVGEIAEAWLTIPAMIIIGREIVISALREWMAELGKRTSVAVSYVGKLKTAAQMLAILILLMSPTPLDGWTWLSWLGVALLYIAAALTLWSMVIYLKAAWPDLDPFERGQ